MDQNAKIMIKLVIPDVLFNIINKGYIQRLPVIV